MIRWPKELSPYVDFDMEKKEWVAINLPDELKEDFEKFKAYLKKLEEEYPLSDF